MIDRKERAFSSHYQTAVAIRDELSAGHVEEASRGIEELICALSRSERRALRSRLIRLMAHVIKWECQPDRRSWSWVGTIADARVEIREIREETPSPNDEVIRSLWDSAVRSARREARGEVVREPEWGADPGPRSSTRRMGRAESRRRSAGGRKGWTGGGPAA